MGHSQFSQLLFQLQIYSLETCETIVFIALAVRLTIHTIRLIIGFCHRMAGRGRAAVQREANFSSRPPNHAGDLPILP
jgi:hypothetical protein